MIFVAIGAEVVEICSQKYLVPNGTTERAVLRTFRWGELSKDPTHYDVSPVGARFRTALLLLELAECVSRGLGETSIFASL